MEKPDPTKSMILSMRDGNGEQLVVVPIGSTVDIIVKDAGYPLLVVRHDGNVIYTRLGCVECECYVLGKAVVLGISGHHLTHSPTPKEKRP